MKFQLEVKPKPGADIEKMTVIFDAPHWPAASQFATVLLRQIGYADAYTEITYAPKEAKAHA